MKSNESNSCFYCYSYKLRLFLQLNDINYIKRYTHNNGNQCWVYKFSPELSEVLDKWKTFKFTFSVD